MQSLSGIGHQLESARPLGSLWPSQRWALQHLCPWPGFPKHRSTRFLACQLVLRPKQQAKSKERLPWTDEVSHPKRAANKGGEGLPVERGTWGACSLCSSWEVRQNTFDGNASPWTSISFVSYWWWPEPFDFAKNSWQQIHHSNHYSQ